MHARRTMVTAIALTLASACTAGTAVVVAVGRNAHAGITPVAADGTPSAPPARAADLIVNGSPIPSVSTGTVAAALAAAEITLAPGHYRSVVQHRRLGSDGRPPRVLVDQRPATLTSPVRAGDRIVVRPGADLIEPTEVLTVAIPPPVPSALYVGSRPGSVRIVRGSLSHEVVSRRIAREPRVGHLVRPGAVALTFDDGPADQWTWRVLKLLEKRHVPATFCLIGRQVATRARLVQRMVRDHDQLCDHTWDHDLALRARPRAQIDLDIRRGAWAITHATHGVHPKFFRAPGGNWSPRMEAAARAQGLIPLKWTVDPRDWARPGVKPVLRTVYAELRPGGVILMHDGGGNRGQTLAALQVLLRRLPKMGYHFVLPPSGPAATD